ncbi:MAG: signal peptidase I [Dehalococcoidales bacterium]|nr:signal peptidase I [Dehalococcoidales bacterium]
MKGFAREMLITLGLALVIYLLLQLVIQSSIVNNISMQPTLIEGQRLIIGKVAYTFSEPQRGDIVVVRPPVETNTEYVKRLIGLPGDTVEIDDGKLYLNGIPLDEPYLKEDIKSGFSPYVVPEGRYFLMGDNRNHSNDSRRGWTVTRQDIVGKAWLRIWPLNKWGSVGNYPLEPQLSAAGADTTAASK